MPSAIDCDANATYSPDEETQSLISSLAKKLFNPSSMHRGGQHSRALIEEARASVRDLIGADAIDTVLFTSGASEANNMALYGTLGLGDEVVSTRSEHPCVIAPLNNLELKRVKVTYLSLDSDGSIVSGDFEEAIKGSPKLISIMAANNETGVINPVAELVSRAKESCSATLIHTDAAQLVGKGAVSFRSLGVDMMTLSAHKIGGLSGVGALIIRQGVKVSPLIFGGPQEEKLRGGTENVLGISVFGAVADRVRSTLDERSARMRFARDTFEEFIVDKLPECAINGRHINRLPNTSSIFVPNIRSDDLVVALDLEGILTSSGAACSSGKRDPSHVLLAMGQSREMATSTVRVSMRADMSEEMIERVCTVFVGTVKRMRDCSATKANSATGKAT